MPKQLSESVADVVARLDHEDLGPESSATDQTTQQPPEISEHDVEAIDTAFKSWMARVPSKYSDASMRKDLSISWGAPWYLLGPVGSGKTFAAWGLYMYHLEQTRKRNMALGRLHFYPGMLIANVATMMGDFRFLPIDDKRERLSALCGVKRLVLDDIGCEYSTDFSEDIIFQILDDRYIRERYTAFTSNIDIKNLPYDDRIISRIMGFVSNNRTQLGGRDRRIPAAKDGK